MRAGFHGFVLLWFNLKKIIVIYIYFLLISNFLLNVCESQKHFQNSSSVIVLIVGELGIRSPWWAKLLYVRKWPFLLGEVAS